MLINPFFGYRYAASLAHIEMLFLLTLAKEFEVLFGSFNELPVE